MNCEEFEENIGGYLDAGLVASVRREFASHLLVCNGCRRLFDDICDNIDALRGATRGAPSSSDGADLYFLPPSAGRPGPSVSSHSAAGELRSRSPLTVGEMVSCRAFDVVISEYFEAQADQIDPDRPDRPEWIAITQHLSGCSECATLFSGLRLASAPASLVTDPLESDTSNLESRILAVTCGVRF